MSPISLERRIGISTLFMQSSGETLFDALDLALDAGWTAIEFVPTAQSGHTGYPRTRRCVGIDLDDARPTDLDAVASALSRFPFRGLHAPQLDLNIASRNAGIARESVRQYRQCADFALRIGARWLTFHPGCPNLSEAVGDEAFIIRKNVEFAKEIADLCEKHDLVAGYENLGGFPSLDQMEEILDKVPSRRFGLHLDVGHTWLAPPRQPLPWVRRLGKRIVAVHVHGTYHRPDRGFENHQPLDLDDCTDLPALLSTLNSRSFAGPFIFEIIAKDIPTYLAFAARSRDILLSLHRGTRRRSRRRT
ncbi:MAG: sugar phosphate isomerase/epimerase family protein [Planctomycetota bacterium]